MGEDDTGIRIFPTERWGSETFTARAKLMVQALRTPSALVSEFTERFGLKT